MAGKKQAADISASRRAAAVERKKELDRDQTQRTPGKPIAGSQAWADKNKAEGR